MARGSGPRLVELATRFSVQLQGLVVFAVAFGIPAYLAPHGVDVHHDGIMFKPALDVSQGKMVFRDTFTQYGGVTVLLQAAALKLFGPRLIVIRMQTAVMYGLTFALFWRSWRKLMPVPVATVICLVGSMMGPDAIASSLPWSSVYALFFQGLALLWCMRYFESGREVELFLAGAAASLAFWCRQPVGVFLAGGVQVALVLIALHMSPPRTRAPRAYSAQLIFGQSRLGRVCASVYLFGGGVVLVNAIILLWLAKYGALIHWWKQSIQFAAQWSEGAGHGHALTQILACLFPGGTWSILAIPVAIQAMRATARFLDAATIVDSPVAAQILLVSTVGVTSWLQYYPVPCNYHCYWAGIPMFGVFGYLFYSSHVSVSRLTQSLVTIGVMILIFYRDIDGRIDAIRPRKLSQNVPIKSIPALRGMYTDLPNARSYDALQTVIDQYLRARPEGTIVTTTTEGLFPALTNRQAVYHPMYIGWAGMTLIYPEVLDIGMRYIQEQLPLVVGAIAVPTHVRVANLFIWGYGFDVYAPISTHPVEFVSCDGGGTCVRTPLQ